VNLPVDRSPEQRGRSCHLTSIHDRRVRVARSIVRFRLRAVASARPARPPSFKTNRSTNTRRGFKWALRASRRRAPSSTPFAAHACAPAFGTLQRARTGGWITSHSLRSHYQFTHFPSRSPATSRALFDRNHERNLNSREALNLFNNSDSFNPLATRISENAPACDDCRGPIAAQQRYRDREYTTFQTFVQSFRIYLRDFWFLSRYRSPRDIDTSAALIRDYPLPVFNYPSSGWV